MFIILSYGQNDARGVCFFLVSVCACFWLEWSRYTCQIMFVFSRGHNEARGECFFSWFQGVPVFGSNGTHIPVFGFYPSIYVHSIPYNSRDKTPISSNEFQSPFFVDNGEGAKKKKKKRRTSRLLWTDLDEIVPTPPFSLCVPYKADCGREVAPKLDKITGSPRGVCVCYYYSMSCVAYGNNTVERKASAT